MRVGQRVLGDDLAERLALGMVAVEQRVVGVAAQHGRDLPGQVVNVLHPGVEAEAAGRRHLVRGVAGQENVADAIAVGDDGRGFPRADAEHRDREVRHADAFPDQLGAEFRREILRLPAILLGAVNQEAPAVPAVDGEERRAQILLLDEIERGRPVLDPLGEIGVEQDVDAVVDFLFCRSC